MRYAWRKNVVMIIHSFHDKPVEIAFALKEDERRKVTCLTSWMVTIVGLMARESITWCWNPMASVGTGLGDWTTC